MEEQNMDQEAQPNIPNHSEDDLDIGVSNITVTGRKARMEKLFTKKTNQYSSSRRNTLGEIEFREPKNRNKEQRKSDSFREDLALKLEELLDNQKQSTLYKFTFEVTDLEGNICTKVVTVCGGDFKFNFQVLFCRQYFHS
jgi:hypothetical protein